MEITDVPHLIFMIIITLACAKITAYFFNKTEIPALVGWIIIGIVFAYPFIGDTSIAGILKIDINHVFGSEGIFHNIINKISELGIIFLIFSVGLKTPIKDLMSVGKTAFIIAFFGVLIPFAFGYAYVMFFYDGNTNHALFLAASMVATSVGVTAYVIQNLHLFHTKEAKIIIGAAIIDDILGMIVLAIVSCKIKPEETYTTDGIFFYIFLLIVTIVLSVHIIIPWIQKIIRKYNSTKFVLFIFSIALCIVLALITENLHLTSIVGSFIAGLILSKHAESWELNKRIEPITGYILPFFFINVGLNVSISSINLDIIFKIFFVVILAVIGKYVGCLLGAKISDKSMDIWSMSIVGIGMIPRGEVGILVAFIGLSTVIENGEYGMSSELYSIVVFMSVITTIIAPLLLPTLFKKSIKTT